MSSNQSKSTLDGLPKQFVLFMRTLFDIMDSGKTGYVKFSDIENRWLDNGTKGVIESLRKVTPSNGWLSFERFCAGLKISLLRIKFEHTSKSVDGGKLVRTSSNSLDRIAVPAEISHSPNKLTNYHNIHYHHSNTATVPPNNAISQSRSVSVPHLRLESTNVDYNLPEQSQIVDLVNEWKPLSIKNKDCSLINKTGIVTALKNWQQEIINSNHVSEMKIIGNRRGVGDGKSTTSDIPIDNKHGVPVVTHRKINQRRKEPRRHTVANGIDYNMLKRIKQLEQEREVLKQGIDAVENAKDWYKKQMAVMDDKIKYIGRSNSYIDYSSDANQERLNFQTARIFEINQLLKALVDSSEKGFPLHMNLAVRKPPLPTYCQAEKINAVNRLKQQNHALTKELNQKTERISQLEHEKSALIRELFQARSLQQQNGNSEDTTFM